AGRNSAFALHQPRTRRRTNHGGSRPDHLHIRNRVRNNAVLNVGRRSGNAHSSYTPSDARQPRVTGATVRVPRSRNEAGFDSGQSKRRSVCRDRTGRCFALRKRDRQTRIYNMREGNNSGVLVIVALLVIVAAAMLVPVVAAYFTR